MELDKTIVENILEAAALIERIHAKQNGVFGMRMGHLSRHFPRPEHACRL